MGPTIVLAAERLSVRYERMAACDGIGLDVHEGEIFALLGRNGAGKSSLVRCLLGCAGRMKAWRITVADECAPGRVVVGIGSEPGGRAACRILDVTTGASTSLPGLVPRVSHAGRMSARSGNRFVPSPGSNAARLFWSGGSIVLFDPITRERQVICGTGE